MCVSEREREREREKERERGLQKKEREGKTLTSQLCNKATSRNFYVPH